MAVSDVRQEVAQQIAREYGAKSWYQDYKDLIADEDVEAVVIVTPTKFHTEVAVQAARAGKKIFCEKPLSLSIEGSVEIKDVVEETGVFFQLGFMRRFDSGYLAAKAKADSGEIGNRVQFKSTSRDRERPDLDYLRPENSGGLFVDMGIHDFDLPAGSWGSEKRLRYGRRFGLSEMSEIGDVDNAIVNLYFEDGTIGAIDLSRMPFMDTKSAPKFLGAMEPCKSATTGKPRCKS